MTRNRAKKRHKYYTRIICKSVNETAIEIDNIIGVLQEKKFTSLPRRIRRRLHKTGKHLSDLLIYTTDVVAFYESPEGASAENFFV